MTLLHVATRPFTVDEYNQMAEIGILAEGERVELQLPLEVSGISEPEPDF